MEAGTTDIDAVNWVNDHHCFGCGRLNENGLRLAFYLNEDWNGVWAPFTPSEAFEGYGGIIHGGIICTLLDEVMAWSLYRQQTWAVTGQMNTRFRKPVEVGMPVRAIGKVVRDRGRVIEMQAELRRQDDDVVLADATATFVRVPESQADEWNQRYLGDREHPTEAENRS